jgi:ribosomal protein S18 acetylase RimI-like enzyme
MDHLLRVLWAFLIRDSAWAQFCSLDELDLLDRAWQSPRMATIEPARPEHAEHIQRISAEVFEEFGEYARLLMKFFTTQGVTTYLARVGSDVAGFVMLGFMPWTGSEEQGEPWLGEVLAIAVDPGHQNRGVGTQLMKQAVALTAEMSEWRDVREIRLTCAEQNTRAIEFFGRFGFKVTGREGGSYAGGQKALELSCRWPPRT